MLKRAGKRYNSITLEADSRHLMTDVWTTAGVLVGIVLVIVTGYERLDAIIALLVAANIVVTGYKLLVRSGRGLLEASLPPEELALVKSILDSYQSEGIKYHALRSREAAARQVPGRSPTRAGQLDRGAGHRNSRTDRNADARSHFQQRRSHARRANRQPSVGAGCRSALRMTSADFYAVRSSSSCLLAFGSSV